MSNSQGRVQAVTADDLPTARRRFMLKVLGLGAAGLAAGGAGAWAKSELESANLAAASLPGLQSQLDSANAARAALELSYSTLQAQATDWQTQLIAATNQNAQLSTELGTAQTQNATLQAQLETVQAALEGVNAKLARSGELVGLYEQLEAAGLDGIVEGGMGIMTGAMAALGEPAALLAGGVASARGLLASFEGVLPEFKDAMAWLGQQVIQLKVGLWSVENSAQTTINSAMTGLAAVFGGFVGFVLDHLPFNIGDKVRATLNSVETVLTGTGDLANQAGDRVLLKISKHVEDGPDHWTNTLVTPLRDQTLAPADAVVSNVAAAGTAYTTSLKDPATNAIAQRRAMREQIATFRATHGV